MGRAVAASWVASAYRVAQQRPDRLAARVIGLVSLCFLLLAGPALACSTCAAGSDTKGTYQVMTLIMSALPLLMIFGVGGWVVAKVRKAERAAKTPAPAPVTAPSRAS